MPSNRETSQPISIVMDVTIFADHFLLSLNPRHVYTFFIFYFKSVCQCDYETQRRQIHYDNYCFFSSARFLY